MKLKADKKAQIEKSVKQTQRALDQSIKSSQKMLQSSIEKLERKIISQAAILKTAKDGKLIGLKTNFAQAKRLHATIVKLFYDEYGVKLKPVNAKFGSIANITIKGFKDQGIAAKFTSLDKDVIKVLRSNINKQFVQFGEAAQNRIVRGMYDSVIGQSEFSELTTLFKGIMTGHKDVRGRSMATYAKQYASDSQMQFTRSVRKVKADSIGLEHFAYMGTDIADSRPFCIARRGEVFTREEVESWNDMDWKGKAPGDVWTNLGGYNCRCNLLGIRPDWVEDE